MGSTSRCCETHDASSTAKLWRETVFLKLYLKFSRHLTNNIPLVPISGVLLLYLPHPGDHDVAGGEHDAAHVAHHLPPWQPHLLTLTLFREDSIVLVLIFCCRIRLLPYSLTVLLFTGLTKIRAGNQRYF